MEEFLWIFSNASLAPSQDKSKNCERGSSQPENCTEETIFLGVKGAYQSSAAQKVVQCGSYHLALAMKRRSLLGPATRVPSFRSCFPRHCSYDSSPRFVRTASQVLSKFLRWEYHRYWLALVRAQEHYKMGNFSESTTVNRVSIIIETN